MVLKIVAKEFIFKTLTSIPVPGWSYPQTLEEPNHKPWSCRCHCRCLLCSHPRVLDRWSEYQGTSFLVLVSVPAFWAVIILLLTRFWSWRETHPRIWKWSESLQGIFSWLSEETKNSTRWSRLPLLVVVLFLTSTSLWSGRREDQPVQARNQSKVWPASPSLCLFIHIYPYTTHTSYHWKSSEFGSILNPFFGSISCLLLDSLKIEPATQWHHHLM